jgi:hypothetical protein
MFVSIRGSHPSEAKTASVLFTAEKTTSSYWSGQDAELNNLAGTFPRNILFENRYFFGQTIGIAALRSFSKGV